MHVNQLRYTQITFFALMRNSRTCIMTLCMYAGICFVVYVGHSVQAAETASRIPRHSVLSQRIPTCDLGRYPCITRDGILVANAHQKRKTRRGLRKLSRQHGGISERLDDWRRRRAVAYLSKRGLSVESPIYQAGEHATDSLRTSAKSLSAINAPNAVINTIYTTLIPTTTKAPSTAAFADANLSVPENLTTSSPSTSSNPKSSYDYEREPQSSRLEEDPPIQDGTLPTRAILPKQSEIIRGITPGDASNRESDAHL